MKYRIKKETFDTGDVYYFVQIYVDFVPNVYEPHWVTFQHERFATLEDCQNRIDRYMELGGKSIPSQSEYIDYP